MKKCPISLFLLLISFNSYTQEVTVPYEWYIQKADSLFQIGSYLEAARSYENSFSSNHDKGLIQDRYNAACSWALAGIPDSAFYQLQRIVYNGRYNDYDHLFEDEDLNSLHTDDRWKILMEEVKANKEKSDDIMYKSLSHSLDSIFEVDQNPRSEIDQVKSRYGSGSAEMKAFWTKLRNTDSLNLVFVKSVLNQYGWLGPREVGERGNSTLFLVIQHANLETQEQYLPMMQDAVKRGKAKPTSLALLVDRIEMRNDRPQIYGSQVTINKVTGDPEVYRIGDEIHVNERRASVGLEPLERYLKNWNMDYHLPEK